MKKNIFALLFLSGILFFYFKGSVVTVQTPNQQIQENTTHHRASTKSSIFVEESTDDMDHSIQTTKTIANKPNCFSPLSFDPKTYRFKAQQFIDLLSSSDNNDDKLYFALFNSLDGDKARYALRDFIENASPTPIAALSGMALCSSENTQRCSTDYLNKIAQQDRNNGAIWFYKAIAHAQLQNHEAVIESINELSNSAYFNERIGEQALLYAQALSASQYNHFNENALAGFTKAISNGPSYLPITKWCHSGTENREKVIACLSLGKELAKRSHVSITQLVGLTLQKNAYRILQDDDSLTELERLKSNIKAPANDKAQQIMDMITQDERLMRRWLTLMDEYGEQQTQQLLIEEAKILFEENTLTPCALMDEA